MEINDLDIVDANNTGRMPENQASSSVNNGVRALEGILARWHEDTNGSVASTGSANAYLFAAKQTLSAYYDGLTVTFDANFTNTDAATLNVDSVSADAIVWPDQTALVAGDIVSGAKVTVRHDGTSWQLINRSSPVIEIGTKIATTSGTTVDFTGIRAGVKRITLMLDAIEKNGTDTPGIRLGDSGGFETSGYNATVAGLSTPPAIGILTTSGLIPLVDGAFVASTAYWSVITFTLMDVANNTWMFEGKTTRLGTEMWIIAGEKSLSGPLTQIRLFSTDTWSAGALNVAME